MKQAQRWKHPGGLLLNESRYCNNLQQSFDEIGGGHAFRFAFEGQQQTVPQYIRRHRLNMVRCDEFIAIEGFDRIMPPERARRESSDLHLP